MSANGGQDPLFLQQIISRYENEEDDFLREIESMQQCTTNTDTSDDFQDESPVLGTLCSLVSEITDLRKQNRKLRRRLIESTSMSPPVRPNRGTGVVNRVSAVFMDSRDKILPRFKSQNRNSLCGATRSKKHMDEIRTGARERMSSPPHKDLTLSSYSTDLSSDTFSSYTHRRPHNYSHHIRKPPPLVLPESSDSDAELRPENSPLPEYDPSSMDENCLSPCYDDSPSNQDSKSFFTLSDQTSPSSTSASSCTDVPSVMTESRTSILDFFRRKRDKLPISPVPFSSKVAIKKRKKRTNDNELGLSKAHNSNPDFVKENEHLSTLTHIGGSSPNIKANTNETAAETDSIRTRCSIDNDQGQSSGLTLSSATALTTKHVSKSVNNVAGDRKTKRQFHHFYEESEDDYEEEGVYRKKSRPKSVVYLDPGELMTRSKLKAKTKSNRSISSRSTSASDDTNQSNLEIGFGVKEENTFLRNEIEVLRHRNNRLIDQLREKSMQLSRSRGKTTDAERELNICRQKSHLNDALDKLCLKDRLSMTSQAVIETLEERLFEFDKRLQAVRNDAIQNQKVALDTALKEQNTYQSQLEQIEHLQRENMSILQLKVSESSEFNNALQQKLDLMPSYDAMYSFAMGIVRKLGQLRSALLEKSAAVATNELEILQLQSNSLVAQAQAERMRHQIHMLNKQNPRRRPASFHGENLLDKLIKPHLNFYLPLREFGNRIERQRRVQSTNIEQLVETNEQSIETEFLRLFDYARTLSKIHENNTPLTRQKSGKRESLSGCHNGLSSASPIHSPVTADRRRVISVNQPAKNARISTLRDKSISHVPAKRPMSLVETKDQKFSGNIRKFGEEMHKLQHHDVIAPKYNDVGAHGVRVAPTHKMSNCGKSGHVKAIVSSLQDVSHFQSPTTTPILARKVPTSVQSPKLQRERRLVKQSSLQHPPGMYRDYEKDPPMYDCPPRHETSDYHSINYQMSSSTGSANNQSMFSSTGSNGIARKVSVERRVPLQKRQINQPQVPYSRLPQPSGSTTPVIDLARSNSVLARRNSGSKTESPYLARSALRHSLVNNAPTRSNTTSPLAQRRLMMYQQPNVLANLQQNLHSYPSYHEQTIKEEDEPRSISVSEASITTTIERSSAPTSSSVVTNNAPSSTSRLPKFSPQFERAKKAGSSWLSKFRINNKK